MARWPWLLVLAAALPPAAGPAAPSGRSSVPDPNSCVTCHRKPETIQALPPWRQEQYLHWYGSVHGRHAVTCDRCHGGDPAQDGAAAAHAGVGPASDPGSRVYYRNLPETCGACHEQVRDEFEQSRHFEQLKADRLGPTCTTCHGFQMEIARVEPAKLAGRCAVCHHDEPQGVHAEVAPRTKALLERVEDVRTRIARAQVVLDLAGEKAAAPPDAAAALRLARERLQDTRSFLHRFELDAFERELDDIGAVADEVHAAARKALFGK